MNIPIYCEKCGVTCDHDDLFEDEPFVCPICVETCEHQKDVLKCEECNGPFGVGM